MWMWKEPVEPVTGRYQLSTQPQVHSRHSPAPSAAKADDQFSVVQFEDPIFLPDPSHTFYSFSYPKGDGDVIKVIVQNGTAEIPKCLAEEMGDFALKFERGSWGEVLPDSELLQMDLTKGGQISSELNLDDFIAITQFASTVRDRVPPPPRVVTGMSYTAVLDFAVQFNFQRLKSYVLGWIQMTWIPSLVSTHWMNGRFGSEVERIVHTCDLLGADPSENPMCASIVTQIIDVHELFVIREIVTPIFATGMECYNEENNPPQPPYNYHCTMGTIMPPVASLMNARFQEKAVPKIKEMASFVRDSFPLWWNFIGEKVFERVKNKMGVSYDQRLALIAAVFIEEMDEKNRLLPLLKAGQLGDQ